MNITDAVCKQHHLSVIEHNEQTKGMTHWEWDLNRQGLSWKTKLKYAIDQAVMNSGSFEDFLAKCAEYGVLVEYNPDHKIDLKFMLAEQKAANPRARYTRSRTLGWFYETEQIKKRIAQYQGMLVYTPRTKVRIVTRKEDPSKFVRDSIDRANMKLTSKAMNILAKYGVTVDEAKQAAVSAYSVRVKLVQELNQISAEIEDREAKIEVLRQFREVSPVYQEYKALTGRKQQKYKTAHGNSLNEYHTLKKKILEWYPNGRVPTVEQQEKRIAELKAQRSQKNADYKALDLKAKELSQASAEIEAFLRQEQSLDQQKRRKRSELE